MLGILLLSAALIKTTPPPKPRSFQALMNDAIAAREAGELKRTVALLRQAYKLKQDPAIQNNLGKVLTELGRYKEAVVAYRMVADDPQADPNLRALDAGRLAALTPKLERAWVMIKKRPYDAVVLIDGAQPENEAEEIGLTGAVHTFEFRELGGADSVLRWWKLPMGMRVNVEEDLRTAKANDATLLLADVHPRLTALELNGYRIETWPRTTDSVRVKAGKYTIKAVFLTGDQVTLNAELEPGERAELADVLTRVKRKEVDVNTGAGPWGYITAGAGLALTGVGIYMLTSALADRDELETATTPGADGFVRGISYTDARQQLDDAGSNATIGIALTGIGGAAVISGITWVVVETMSVTARSGRIKMSFTPNGVFIGGRF